MNNEFYLIDLERTIGIGRTFYWKAHSGGYTTKISDAGLYSENVADQIVESDFDKRTIKVNKNIVERILK